MGGNGYSFLALVLKVIWEKYKETLNIHLRTDLQKSFSVNMLSITQHFLFYFTKY